MPSLRDSVEAEIKELLANSEAALKSWDAMSIDHINPSDAGEVASAALRWADALHVVVLRLAQEIDLLKAPA